LRSFTTSSNGADAGERRIRRSGSGKIRGSSHGPGTTNGRSKPAAALGAKTRWRDDPRDKRALQISEEDGLPGHPRSSRGLAPGNDRRAYRVGTGLSPR
jgi:hypothetical protein